MAEIAKLTRMVEDAVAYARLGLRVVPVHHCITTGDCPSCSCNMGALCQSAGKHPILKDWARVASADPEQVRTWYQSRPYANIGIAAGAESGIVCIDIDPGHGGEESLAQLVAENGPLPPTWEARTGSGGRHLIFRHPGNGLKLGNTQHNKPGQKLGRGLDIRGDGGQFVAPPSLHHSGRRYEWINPPATTTLADLPAWILARIIRTNSTQPAAARQRQAASRYGAQALANELQALTAATDGNRNIQLNTSAFSLFQLVGGGVLDERDVIEQLTAAAKQIGLDDTEIARTLESARGAGTSKPRGMPARNGHQPAAAVNGHVEPADPGHQERAQDDPGRLASLYLAKRCHHDAGPTIRYWREEWYRWRYGVYRIIPEADMRAEMTQFIATTFEAEYRRGEGEWEGRGNDGRLVVRRVYASLVHNTLQSLAGMVHLPNNVTSPMWLDDESRHANYFSFRNGLVDAGDLLTTINAAIRPHSPLWFTLTRFDFTFSPDSRCPHWDEFLRRNLEGDQERINLLQEWFGYCLLPDTSLQKFLLVVGEGANGKSVLCAALSALIGLDNVSAVPLELFGERFQLTTTIGRLVNLAAEIGELDKAAEGHLKSFVSGDLMLFDRKGKSAIQAKPTARLVLATNNLPRFSDKSSGLWRRMIYMPLRVTVPEHERMLGMDKAEWWMQENELPGMFVWALGGLRRLCQNQRFTEPKLSAEAVESYRAESNPARMFLLESVHHDPAAFVACQELYAAYKSWAQDNGYHPLSEVSFGKEVHRAFSTIKRVRRETGTGRRWVYMGIAMAS